MQSCPDLGIPAALEISRSGNGTHTWIFFADTVPARKDRQLKAALISHNCNRTRRLSLASYDRLFPNQDTMPNVGFGSLAAPAETAEEIGSPCLPLLLEALGNEVGHCFVLHGRLSKNQRTAVLSELDALDESAPRVLLAAGRLIGEGFDHPPLDTLVLVLAMPMPISWKGTLQQYTGRLHREPADKRDVRIYDYAGTDQPRLTRMWGKRQRSYRAMGYEIKPMDAVISGNGHNLT